MDTLSVLDNDETKCLGILAEHVDRIQNAIPSKPIHMQYPKPIHRLLSIQPLKRIEIPLVALDVLVSSGFNFDEYFNNDRNYYGKWQHDEMKITCLHLAVKNHHHNAVRWLVQHGANCDKYSYDESLKSLSSYSSQYITPITMLASHRDAPLDLFDKLKFPKNFNSYSNLPLHVAVQHGHTNIALHLLDLGASVNCLGSGTRPLHIAAEHGHTELALSLMKHGATVDLLDGFGDTPLCLAIWHGHSEVALSLIKHGANVSQSNRHGILPITFYVKKVNADAEHFNDAIFTKLIPEIYTDIFNTICQIVEERKPCNAGEENKLEVLSSMLCKLIQHLIVTEPLSITIREDISYFEMKLNQHVIVNCAPLRTVYLCSVLVIFLGCKVSYVDAIVPQLLCLGTSRTEAEHLLQAHAIDDVWKSYKQKKGVRKLQVLCIPKTRQFLYSLTDESFQSLPVPSCLRKMLMLQDIAEILFEGYQMWPKCISIEELMHM